MYASCTHRHSSCLLEEPNHQQKNYGTNRRVNDCSEYPSDDHKPYSRQKPARDDRPNDPDDDIANDPEPIALHKKAGESARDTANNEPNDQVN
jgi:hypothetical protein